MTSQPDTAGTISAKSRGDRNASAASEILASVEKTVRAVTQAHGVELFDLSFRVEQGGWVLRVTLDVVSDRLDQQGDEKTPGMTDDGDVSPVHAQTHRKTVKQGKLQSEQLKGVTVDQCADVSHDLSTALDVMDLIPFGYTLEVTTPGVERPLRTVRDYERFCGSKAKITLMKSHAELGSVIRAHLAGVRDKSVLILLPGDREMTVRFADIKRANLLYEIPTQSKKKTKKKKTCCSSQRRH